MSTNKRPRGRILARIRDQARLDNPLCHGPDSECEKLGRVREWEICDHVKPITFGGLDTPDNRQFLCADCDRKKTARDFGYQPRRRIGLSGWPEDD